MSKETVQLKPARFYWFTPWGLAIGASILLWRYFVSGRELRGDGDNATWLHDATVDHRGRPYERLTRARWRRVARRWALLGVPLALGMAVPVAGAARAMGAGGPARWPWGSLLVAYVIAVGTVGAGLGVRAFAAWWPLREVRRALVRPAAEVLCRLTGVKVPRRKLHHLIEIPPRFGEKPEDGAPPHRVRVTMPGNVPLPDKKQAEIVSQMGARLGLPHARGEWTMAGERAYVELTAAPLPPSALTFADVRGALDMAEFSRPLFGMTAGRRLCHLDYHNDSPHVLGSAPSGAGKSAMLKLIAMQRMRHGAGAIFIDFKKWSHLRWVRGLPPSVALYFHEIPSIHDALVAVMEETIARKNIDHEDELDAMRPLDIYVEEMNTLTGMLIEYWRGTVAEAKARARTALLFAKDSGDPEEIARALEEVAAANSMPAMSPAVQALRWGVNLGREFKVHFYFIGQSMSAHTAGGRDTRASFRTRLLARWDRKDWRMLADGVPFVACPSAPVGLWAHVHGAEVDVVRVPWVSDVQAREFVLSGDMSRTPVLSRDIGGQVSSLGGQMSSSVQVDMSIPCPLSEILSMLPEGRGGKAATLKALQLAAGRPGFPEPARVGEAGKPHLYRAGEVLEWWEEREGVQALGM